MDQQQTRQAVYYSLFVNQNPSLKNYVVTMGFRSRYRTDEELRTFCSRITGKRSMFPIYGLALTYVFAKSFIPN